MNRQPRLAGGLRQPDRAGLGDARRSARPVESESRRLPSGQIAHELQDRLASTARRRSTRSAVPESLDDAGDPFSVEVLARDDDDAAAAEVVRRRKDAAVPEGHHRLAAAGDDRVEMFETFGLPPKRGSEKLNEAIAQDRDETRLESFRTRRAPVSDWRIGELASW